MSATDAKLDLILEQLKDLGPIRNCLEDMKASIVEVKVEVNALQYDVAIHNDRISALERDMLEQKDMANRQQQQLRSLTLRIFNFPESPDETADNNSGLRTCVYDTVLKPLLTAAKAAKELTSVPQMATVVEACFRPLNISNKNQSGPPHVIVKVSSKLFKVALMKNRKHLPKPPDKDTKRIMLVEDLTPVTHKMFTAIAKARDMGKVWTIDGNIKFSLEGKTTVQSVKSVFMPLAQVIDRT